MRIDALIAYMQMAVDAVASSPHPTNKIAATIAGGSEKSAPFAITQTNHWPQAIANTIGSGPEIGNSSGTLHAETACIFEALRLQRPTQNAAIFITDPPCPNCMKNLAESGITKLYIDHKGFDKDWSKRRGESFEQMSLRIAEKAGIDVHVLYRKEARFEIISKRTADYKPNNENPPLIHTELENFESALKRAKSAHNGEIFALALAKDSEENPLTLSVGIHPTIGYSYESLDDQQNKYSFLLQPLNRLLMIAARNGYKLEPNSIYSSSCPTARELVNFVGAGFEILHIEHEKTARDQFGPLALAQLTKAGILQSL